MMHCLLKERIMLDMHHVAISMGSEAELMQLHKKLVASGAVGIEFAPELLRGGPALHMICIEPSGIRIEFIWTPQ